MQENAIHYAILGDGRLARHMRQYLGQLGLPCSGWSRKATSPFNSHPHTDARTRLLACLAPASHVVLLVADDALAGLLRQYPVLQQRRLVHCAGALSLPGVGGAHPLMSFADEIYTLEEYQNIPFMVESGHRFEDLFPGLPNPHYPIELKDKALYHALCVMAGNFPQILWQAVFKRFEDSLAIPPAVLESYLRRVLENTLADPANALTGPLARGDQVSITRNLVSLDADPLKALYQSFTGFHQHEHGGSQSRRPEQKP